MRNGEFYHFVLGRLAASLAAIDPKKKNCSLCEIFGNYGWEEGVRLEKYLLDHFLVRGSTILSLMRSARRNILIRTVRRIFMPMVIIRSTDILEN